MFVHFIETLNGHEIFFNCNKIIYLLEKTENTTYVGLDKNTLYLVNGSIEEVETKLNKIKAKEYVRLKLEEENNV